VEEFSYAQLDHLVERSLKVPGSALLIAVDHITDEGNLGSLIRTAAFFGSHGLIIPKDRSAGVTARVLKSASGVHNYLPVARVINLGMSLKALGKKGFWIIGTSAGESLVSVYQFDWKRDLVLVLGNEQKGLSPSIKRLCHQIVKIPSTRQVESLNVSVAGGVILAEIKRQRAH
jgi:23S rRNA (guanosine2251-2'-O)-methyltransferase